VTLSELEEKLSKLDKKQTVVLSSDKEAEFQHFVEVMDILKRLEHEQLYIVTNKKEG
jgi:biopolymer transport protein ExbD